MKTKTNKSVFIKSIIFLLIFLFTSNCYAADSSKWTIAAKKFTYQKGYEMNSVTEGSAQMLPMSILEKLSKNIERNVLPDERFNRENYKLRTERQSLYLQLSSEYKKRDALFLEPYTDKELSLKIKEQEKVISDIKEKINNNLDSVKELQEVSEKNMELVKSGKLQTIGAQKTEKEIIKNFFHNIFLKDESVITQEQVMLYGSSGNEYATLYQPKDDEPDYLSGAFEKNIVTAGINTLITGVISGVGDYISVAVDLYLYPGARKIGTVTEIGTLQEAELITSSIATQLVPFITNAMPVYVNIKINSENKNSEPQVYIDDIIQSNYSETIVLDSGVHTIQFVSKGYRSAGTTYYFSGNTVYNIDVDLQEQIDGYMQIQLIKPLTVPGDFLTNGESAIKVNENKSQIKINGKNILGEFITENGETAFFYIPENMVYNGNMLKINPKAYDREKNIDKRRKWMYASYSLLMVSLIPTFYSLGNLMNGAKLYNDGLMYYSDAIQLQKNSNLYSSISIGCGVFFAFELLRYLIAANSVLPQKVKTGNILDYEYYDPAVELNDKEIELEDNTKDIDENNIIKNAE